MELTARIERMETLEDRVGISLEALYAAFEYNDYGNSLRVNFDVIATAGELSCNIHLVVGAYNSSGQLLATDTASAYEEDFFGLDSMSVRMDCSEPPARIRVYPKKW